VELIKAIGNRLFWFMLKRRGAKSRKHLDALSRSAVRTSEQTLAKLLADNADTEYGRKYDFAGIRDAEDYRKKVPLSNYHTYEPYIKRMIENSEENLITRYPIRHYALTSGSSGAPKHIPVSQAGLDICAENSTVLCIGVMDEFYRTTTGRSLKNGYCLNTIEAPLSETESGVPKGTISGTVLKPYKKLLRYFLTSPDEILFPTQEMNMKYMKLRFALQERNVVCLVAPFMTAAVDLFTWLESNWTIMCDDIENGQISPDIHISQELRRKLEAILTPNPKRAQELREEFQNGFKGIVPRIWPNFQWIGSIGTAGFTQYTLKMRHYTGKNVPYNYLEYSASEALIAAERRMGETAYVLVPDGGFFEFIPVDPEEQEEQETEPVTLTIDEIEQGKDYEIVITNLSGFYRYRIGDIVRVTGFYNEAPALAFMYRKNQLISIAGEKTNDEALRWTIARFQEETGVEVNDYSIFADTDTKPGRYVFLLEPDQDIPSERLPTLRDNLEKNLSLANLSFGQKITTGVLGRSKLCIAEKETYMLYRDLQIMKGVSPNQLKPIRVIDTPEKRKFFFGLLEKESD